jgi:hypothetical protein
MPDIYVAPKKKKVTPKKVKTPKKAVKKEIKGKNEVEKLRRTHTANPLAAYVSSPRDIRF